MWNNLTDQERTALTVLNDSREIDGMEQGVARYRRALEHVELARPSQKIVCKCIEPLAEAIKADQNEMLHGAARRGRPSSWASSYVTMDAGKLALITLVAMFNVDDTKLTTVALMIADRVKVEHEYDEIRRLNRLTDKGRKGFAVNMTDKLRDKDKVRKLYKRLAETPLRWTPTHRAGLGAHLIKKAVDSLGLWSVDKRYIDGKTVAYLNISDELSMAIASGHSDIEILRPISHPMSCPPLDWSIVNDNVVGGYRLSYTQFVRDRYGEHPSTYAGDGIGPVLRALNAIQAVEWRIDEDILGLATTVYATNSPEFNGAIKHLRTKPNIPPYDKEFTPAERKIWKQNKAAAKTEWSASASVRSAQLQAIRTAKMCVGQPVFFPHSLDWRGRIYPVPVFLSPQGFDLQKALLRYAEKIPIGLNGLRNLKIAAAGHAGVDKVPFDDRVKWFDENYPDVRKFDPLEDYRWVDYDSPFLFVQTIKEIANVIRSGKGEHYESDISITVDGSQNGIQHLSAIGLDDVGGGAVNLVDAEVPADLYSDVADIVYASIVGDQERAVTTGVLHDELGEELPPLVWLPRLDTRKKRRSIVKRSVLAYPYGVTKPGMRDGLIADGFLNGVPGSRHRNAWYLAEKIDESVRDVVIRAAQLMDWFRLVADIAAKDGKTLKWVTPSGFPVNMHYFVRASREIKTCLVRLTIREPIDKTAIDGSAQVRGIVANFIHSLDAAHLVATVNGCLDDGMSSFQFIHDSYGCHVGRIDRMNEILRDKFVEMHSTDPIIAFRDGLGFDAPPLPDKGNLILEDVKKSKFFFA
jgi:DNA-directed RNA polymerase